MVIFYDLKTGIVVRTEDFVSVPTFPIDLENEDKPEFYKTQGEGYIAIKEELGLDAFMYKVIVNENGEFETLHPRGVGESGVV